MNAASSPAADVRARRAARSMVVAGVMSGTSADGVDVALCRISDPPGTRKRSDNELVRPAIELLHHRAFPFPAALRRAVLAAMNATSISAAELARLNWRLGQAYAEYVTAIVANSKTAIDLVGCHGQTIYHQARPAPYAGRRVACTWQLGEMALVAAAAGVPVVSNFRPADIVAGGQGAPLVPLLDFVLFADPKRGRVLQNLGGIANLTIIPPGCAPADVIAFDTGPANMVIDALMEQLFGKPFDREGRTAARGAPDASLLALLLRDPYFRKQPPKSAGREQYGAEFVARFLRECESRKLSPVDAVATATALTAGSIRIACERFVAPRMAGAPVELIVSGGGARNRTLIAILQRELAPLHCTAPLHCSVVQSDAFGIPSEAKEAVAFALLAYQTWHHRAGNVPSATGASRPAILGQVTYV